MCKKPNPCEIAIVITVIVITLSTIIPLVRASVNDDIERCAANGRKVCQALLMYMDDYSGKFPSGPESSVTVTLPTWNYSWIGGIGSGSGKSSIWRYFYLRKYVKDDSIWVCPNPTNNYAKRYAALYRANWWFRNSDDFLDGDRGFQQSAIDMGINEDVNHDGKIDGSDIVGLTTAEVEALDAAGETECGSRYMPPRKKVIAMCYGIGEWGSSHIDFPPSYYVFPAFPHKDGSVFVYVDGHAAWKQMGTGWAPAGYTNLPIDRVPSTRPQY